MLFLALLDGMLRTMADPHSHRPDDLRAALDRIAREDCTSVGGEHRSSAEAAARILFAHWQ